MRFNQGWSYKEIEDFYDRVRAVLDNLSSASLPDKYIDMPEKAPFAELYAKSKVRTWASLDETNAALFESAIVYKTASLFESLVSSNAIKKKELPTISLEYFQNKSIQMNGLSLGELADSLLDEINGFVGIGVIGFEVT